ncbi:MAG: RluA family pseudouridine synthase [Prevotella sp.]|nr:RluA family pseudouridine synthase [Prevotella sp.]
MKWDDVLFHCLPVGVDVPDELNDPFDYEPDASALAAWNDMRVEIARRRKWHEEIDRGKMFGVLVVVDAEGRAGYLAAYSGQIGGRCDWQGFVPAVFDYLSPDGHFKTKEAEISAINAEIAQMYSSEQYLSLQASLKKIESDGQQMLSAQASAMRMAKQQRDQRRKEGYLSATETAEMIRESQFLKAELRRAKKMQEERVAAVKSELQPLEDAITALKRRRHEMSDELQQWLFMQFDMLNSRGESRNLIDIFASTPQQIPPSGSGECCEPRLLQYAFAHGLTPRSMAMFWWGESPKDVVRHDGHYYPACSGKCKPILAWMLSGLTLRRGPIAGGEQQGRLDVIYDDEHFCVVNKPAGMLSVPGRGDVESVVSILRREWGGAAEPLVVHRLDMATSGLLIVAKDADTQRLLQSQFARRKVEKRYVALLEKRLPAGSGRISLPLRADVENRPYQVVDHERGRRSQTDYEILSDGRVVLTPLNGRTHQLRVHCAHREGLGCPIKGDALYGHPADRLYLHAERLVIDHPTTGQQMTFYAPCPF